MIYQLLHRLFGWDYVAWKNSADRGIARVHLDGRGACYYWRYKSMRLSDRITHADQVLWLTCEPGKYFQEDLSR